jgi:hypothetical protein
MFTLRSPESPEHGLGRYVGNVGDVGIVQALLDTSPDATPESSTVASDRVAAKRRNIMYPIVCFLISTPQNTAKKKRKDCKALSA